MKEIKRSLRAAIGTAVLLAGMGVAQAAQLNQTNSTVNTGTLFTDNVTTTLNAGVQSLAVPGSYFYGDTYTVNLTHNVRKSDDSDTGYEFYDTYVFQITDATANSITTTIDLGSALSITNLNERLYKYTGSAPELSGTPTDLIQGWTYAIGSGASASVIGATNLTAGTYVLEVRGNSDGTSGGSYSGTLNLTAVPVPPALPLLLSGLGALGILKRRLVKAV